jgi:flagellar biosynthetic protein FliR
MRNNIGIPVGTLFAFLFVLARVSGVFVYLPIPGMSASAQPVRAFLSLAITMALFPLWPRGIAPDQGISTLLVTVVSEAALGLAIGVGVALVLEALQMAAQISGLQAGYGFASTIDPTSQADSGVLLVFAQLIAGLLFFTTGLDREVIRIFASSLSTLPPGEFHITAGLAEAMVRLGSGVFSVGLRLALPVVALLGLVDLSLALLGRLNAQMQLMTLAFPAKMLAALALFAWLSMQYPRAFSAYANQFLTLAAKATHGG